MLKRKIEERLLAWKSDSDRKPLIIKGCRQCGKTFSVRYFAEQNYAHVVYLNFFENPALAELFSGSLDVDYLTMLMEAEFGPKAVFAEGKTVIILDEIQECPQARTALKFFKLDGRYDVIATGSLLGVKGYGNDPASIPVGYETTMEMYPLDFEEFLWANGISNRVINQLRTCLEAEESVPAVLHEKFSELFRFFAVVGGMPDAVVKFVDAHRLNDVLQIQRDLVASYKDDMVKYASPADKGRIRECFESVPKQLAKENKKFQYSSIRKGGRSSDYLGSIQWIEDAGITSRCYNLTIPELPLSGSAMEDVFKVYMNDPGLFVSMLDDGSQADILRGNLYTYKGAVFENLIAGIFRKMGRPLYYFHKDSGLEIDFVIRYKGDATLVEIKASNGKTKSAATVLGNPDKYHVGQCIKICEANVSRAGRILTIPHYMAFLLTEL